MSNEELKEKICKIIAPYISAWGEDERIADALIAAGLTFEPMTFRIVENKPYSYTTGELANWKEDQECIAKLLHRAAAAEKALLMACANAVKDEKDNVNIELLVRVVYDKYLKQAERELAKEDNNNGN